MFHITLDEIAYRVLPQVRPGRALADPEWRTLVRTAEALLSDLPFELTPERVADNVEAFLIEGRSRRAWRCRVLLTLIEHATWAEHRRPFSQLSTAQRRQLIQQRFVDGRHIWAICAKIRYLVLMGAYGDARALDLLDVRHHARDRVRPQHAPVTARSSRSLPLVS